MKEKIIEKPSKIQVERRVRPVIEYKVEKHDVTADDIETLSQLITKFNNGVAKNPIFVLEEFGHEIHPDWVKYFISNNNGSRMNISWEIYPTPLLASMIDKHNSDGESILYLACRYGVSTLPEKLLECESMYNMQNTSSNKKTAIVNMENTSDDKSTPLLGLCYSLFEGRFDIDIDYFFDTINTLIKYGANITKKNGGGHNGYIFINGYLNEKKEPLIVNYKKEFLKLLLYNAEEDVIRHLLIFFFSNDDDAKNKLKRMFALIDKCDNDHIIDKSFDTLLYGI